MVEIKVQNDSISLSQSFTKKEVTIGRSVWNDLVIDNPSVSKQHCKISVINKENAILVTDLKSRNGISANGELLHEIDLNSGDSFSIGDIQITVNVSADQDETKEIDISMLKDNRKKIDGKNFIYLFVITLFVSLDYYFTKSDPKMKKVFLEIFETYVGIFVLWSVSSMASCFFAATSEGNLKVFKRKWKYNLQFQIVFKVEIILFLMNFLEEFFLTFSVYFSPLFHLLTLFIIIHYFVNFYNLFFPYNMKKYYKRNFTILSLPILTIAFLIFYNVVIVDREGRLFERYNTDLNFYMPYIAPTGNMSDLEDLLDKVDTLSNEELTSSKE